MTRPVAEAIHREITAAGIDSSVAEAVAKPVEDAVMAAVMDLLGKRFGCSSFGATRLPLHQAQMTPAFGTTGLGVVIS